MRLVGFTNESDDAVYVNADIVLALLPSSYTGTDENGKPKIKTRTAIRLPDAPVYVLEDITTVYHRLKGPKLYIDRSPG
jgi:hypothetical protein